MTNLLTTAQTAAREGGPRRMKTMQRYAYNFVVVEAENDGLSKNEVVGHYFNWADQFSHKQNDRVSEDLELLKKLPEGKYLTTTRQYTGHRVYRATLITGNGGPKDAVFISRLCKW